MTDAVSETKPRIKLETSEGELLLELWPDVAPKTVQNFLDLVHNGFYDGLTFHRILPGFVLQAGCPHGDGTGGPGYCVDAEFNETKHDKGVLSMARTADPNSAGSQFFVCLTREHCQHLDGQYTAFGTVIEGLPIVDKIAETPLSHPDMGTPIHPPTIMRATRVDVDVDDDHGDHGDQSD